MLAITWHNQLYSTVGRLCYLYQNITDFTVQYSIHAMLSVPKYSWLYLYIHYSIHAMLALPWHNQLYNTVYSSCSQYMLAVQRHNLYKAMYSHLMQLVRLYSTVLTLCQKYQDTNKMTLYFVKYKLCKQNHVTKINQFTCRLTVCTVKVK